MDDIVGISFPFHANWELNIYFSILSEKTHRLTINNPNFEGYFLRVNRMTCYCKFYFFKKR